MKKRDSQRKIIHQRQLNGIARFLSRLFNDIEVGNGENFGHENTRTEKKERKERRQTN
jgi:hypothetical protein